MSETTRVLLLLLQRATAVPVEYDPEWPSPCALLPPDEHGMVRWQPLPMIPSPTFDGISLHPSLRDFFGSYWSGAVRGRYQDEAVELRVSWNAMELARTIQVVQAQVQVGEPVFVAHTNSDWYFGVDNTTGAVWLCEPGYPPIRQVAASLADFLAEVE